MIRFYKNRMGKNLKDPELAIRLLREREPIFLPVANFNVRKILRQR